MHYIMDIVFPVEQWNFLCCVIQNHSAFSHICSMFMFVFPRQFLFFRFVSQFPMEKNRAYGPGAYGHCNHCPMKLASVTVLFLFAATVLHSGYGCYLFIISYINDFGLVLYTLKLMSAWRTHCYAQNESISNTNLHQPKPVAGWLGCHVGDEDDDMTGASGR